MVATAFEMRFFPVVLAIVRNAIYTSSRVSGWASDPLLAFYACIVSGCV